MKLNIVPVTLLAALMLAGCGPSGESAQGPAGGAPATGPMVECVVCKHNADMACMEIPLNEKTLSAEYQGKTYYFCSDACKTEFLKNPSKYQAAAK